MFVHELYCTAARLHEVRLVRFASLACFRAISSPTAGNVCALDAAIWGGRFLRRDSFGCLALLAANKGAHNWDIAVGYVNGRASDR